MNIFSYDFNQDFPVAIPDSMKTPAVEFSIALLPLAARIKFLRDPTNTIVGITDLCLSALLIQQMTKKEKLISNAITFLAGASKTISMTWGFENDNDRIMVEKTDALLFCLRNICLYATQLEKLKEQKEEYNLTMLKLIWNGLSCMPVITANALCVKVLKVYYGITSTYEAYTWRNKSPTIFAIKAIVSVIDNIDFFKSLKNTNNLAFSKTKNPLDWYPLPGLLEKILKL